MLGADDELVVLMLQLSLLIIRRLRRWYEANYAETAGISTALLSHLLFDCMANAAADKSKLHAQEIVLLGSYG